MTKSPLLRCNLLVKKSLIHGYGVFADQDIQPGEIIEECYTLYGKKKERLISGYIFESVQGYAFPLGYGVIYNHSDQPNAECLLDVGDALTVFRAIQRIKKGEEIFISYGDDWFSSRKLKHKEFSKKVKMRRLLSAVMILLRGTLITGAIFALIIFMRHFALLYHPESWLS